MRRVLLLGALGLVLAGCGTNAALPNTDIAPFKVDPTVSVSLASINGGDVTVKLSATNFKVVAADEATNKHVYGEGHFHVFVDVAPTAPGEVTPKTKGVYHTTETTLTIPGLGSGRHHLWVVLGYSDHTPYQALAISGAGKAHGTVAELDFTVGPGQTAITPETPPAAQPSPVASAAAAAPSPSPSAASGGGGGASKTVQVVADASNGGAYNPGSLSVAVGDTVKWDWVDDSAQHSVTSDDGKFDSSLQSKGQTFTFKFSSAGTYKYHCSVHPQMVGTVTVK